MFAYFSTPLPLPLSISSYVCVRKIAVKKYTLNYPMVLAVPLYAAQTEARIMIWLLKSTLLVFPLLFSPAIFSIYLFLCVLFFGSLARIHVILSPLFYFLFHNSVCRTKSLDIFFYETIMIALLILVRRRWWRRRRQWRKNNIGKSQWAPNAAKTDEIINIYFHHLPLLRYIHPKYASVQTFPICLLFHLVIAWFVLFYVAVSRVKDASKSFQMQKCFHLTFELSHNAQMNILEMDSVSSPFISLFLPSFWHDFLRTICSMAQFFLCSKEKKTFEMHTERNRGGRRHCRRNIHTHWKIRAHCMPSATLVCWWKKIFLHRVWASVNARVCVYWIGNGTISTKEKR